MAFTDNPKRQQAFLDQFSPYLNGKMLAIFLWSFACGIPLTMATGTLSAYLYQANIPLATISIFSLVTIPYALKFVFAPVIQTKSIPILGRYFGRVRSWMLLAFIGMMIGLFLIAQIPITATQNLPYLFCTVLLTILCASINDTAEAEYRIELLQAHEYGHGMACYSIGYRLGMITGGGLALMMAAHMGWSMAFNLLALVLLLGIGAVLLQPHANSPALQNTSQLRVYLESIRLLFAKSGIIYAILLIIFYYFAEDLLIMMLNPFLLQKGITMNEIGLWQGSLGGFLSIMGGLIGGVLVTRLGFTRILILCSFLFMFSNALFVPLALIKMQHLNLLHSIFKAQAIFGNFFMGISAPAYITLIAKQCERPFTASQNAFLTSLMAGSKSVLAAISGYIAVQHGWVNFFIITSLIFLTILGLLYLYQARLKHFNLRAAVSL